MIIGAHMHAPLVGADVVADVVDRRVPVIVVIGPGPIIVQAAKRVHAPSSSDEIFVGSDTVRSEEHTSELQSLMRISYAVFCLKKKIQTHKYDNKGARTQQYRAISTT